MTNHFLFYVYGIEFDIYSVIPNEERDDSGSKTKDFYMLQRLGIFLCVVLSIAFLNSCSCGCNINPCNPCIVGQPVPPICPNPTVCTVQLCKEPIVCTIADKNRRIAYLIQHGVKILHVGETITIVLPSDYLFYPNSANINP